MTLLFNTSYRSIFRTAILRIAALQYLPVIFILCFLNRTSVYSQGKRLIEFELEDQFKRTYTHQDFIGSFMIMAGSDEGGSNFNGLWAKAIENELDRDSTDYRVQWVGLADLRSVPFFMKGIVRGMFPDEEREWVLLDWDGLFAEHYQFKPDHSNILVFDASGELIYITWGREVDKEKVEKICSVIRNKYR